METIAICGWLYPRDHAPGIHMTVDEIGSDAHCIVEEVISRIDSATGVLLVQVDSPGGSVGHAGQVAAHLRSFSARGGVVIAHVLRAWSAAPAIVTAADFVVLEPGPVVFDTVNGPREYARIMFHSVVGELSPNERIAHTRRVAEEFAAGCDVDVDALLRITVHADLESGSDPGDHCAVFSPDVAFPHAVIDAEGTFDQTRRLALLVDEGARLPETHRQSLLAARRECRHAS